LKVFSKVKELEVNCGSLLKYLKPYA